MSVAKSAMVWVGYGVVAPEFDWDDFKGVDVRGKTIVMLAGDPPAPDPANPAALDRHVFKGAAAAIIIHETGPAGYAFDVVKAIWGRENFGLAAPDEASRHAAVPRQRLWHGDHAGDGRGLHFRNGPRLK